MKHPALSGPGPFRAFSGFFGPCRAFSGPGLFLGLRLLQSQDPHDFIVQPDPWKESRTISQAVMQVWRHVRFFNDSAEPQKVQKLGTQC